VLPLRSGLLFLHLNNIHGLAGQTAGCNGMPATPHGYLFAGVVASSRMELGCFFSNHAALSDHFPYETASHLITAFVEAVKV